MERQFRKSTRHCVTSSSRIPRICAARRRLRLKACYAASRKARHKWFRRSTYSFSGSPASHWTNWTTRSWTSGSCVISCIARVNEYNEKSPAICNSTRSRWARPSRSSIALGGGKGRLLRCEWEKDAPRRSDQISPPHPVWPRRPEGAAPPYLRAGRAIGRGTLPAICWPCQPGRASGLRLAVPRQVRSQAPPQVHKDREPARVRLPVLCIERSDSELVG